MVKAKFELRFFKVRKNGPQKTCNLFCNIATKRVENDVARFTTNVQTFQKPDLVQDRFDEGGKTRNVSLQLVL